MKKMQTFMVVLTLCVLGIYAYVTQDDSLIDRDESMEKPFVETIQTVWSSQTVFEEQRLAEAEVTVGVLEAGMPEGLPEDKGMEVSCPGEEAYIQSATLQQKKNLIMDERIPTENLYTGADADAFFADAIFVGDSVTLGLSNYYQKLHGGIFAETTQFLAQVGCSAKMCISAHPLEKYSKYMPKYDGRLCRIEDGIALSGAKKVFIDYGLNDLTGSTVGEFVEDFTILLNRIKDKNPAVQIYVISTTYVVNDAQSGLLTNNNIRKANDAIKAYCTENGLGYLNIADYLADAEGGLHSQYSSDQYVHQNTRSYDMWVKVLRHYAHTQMTEM